MSYSIKKVAAAFALVSSLFTNSLWAQAHTTTTGEQYGRTLNLGLGVGYYGNIGTNVPMIIGSYEFDAAKNFTVSPFLALGSYTSSDDYFYNGSYYYYHSNVTSLGAKGTYYFDDLLHAGPKWDFYLAASLGFTYTTVRWDDGYHGGASWHKPSVLFLTAHIGAEYHFNKRLGMFLDLATGLSNVGIAIHHK